MKQTIELLIEQIKDDTLSATCADLLFNSRYALLEIAPAALSWHHNYEGGLLNHTVEVARIAIESVPFADSLVRPCNMDVLITAALWHDIGKIFEYELKFTQDREKLPAKCLEINTDEETGKIRYWKTGEFYKQVYHISGSAMEFHHSAMNRRMDEGVMRQVEHAILGHHGPVKDWGSPVEPQTIEALILHHADMLSSKFGPTMRKP